MTPRPATIHTFEQFRDAVYAFRLPRILLSALELDIFNTMEARQWTIPELAKRLQVSPRGLAIVCRNLASVGLLTYSQRGIRVSSFSKHYLQKTGKEYRGEYLALMQRQWNEWTRLTETISTGQPVDAHEPETPEYRQSFTWAMHHRSKKPAREVSHQVDLKGARTLLDLGGGPGTYALQFLKHHPQLQATLMDRPAALEVARILARQSPSGSRLSYHALDFVKDPIPGRYDIVWFSNVLHIYSPSENLRIFKKIRRALTPGGRLLIQDTFLHNDKKLHPLEANLFAVTMLLYTEQGNTYSVQEVRAWLHQAGLRQPRLIRLQDGTGDWEGRLMESRR